jgi:hypothetical protein
LKEIKVFIERFFYVPPKKKKTTTTKSMILLMLGLMRNAYVLLGNID